jgi:hypothetical protein
MRSKLYLSAVFALLVTACTQQPEQGYNTSQSEYRDSQQTLNGSQQYREDDGFGVGEFVAGAAVGHLLTSNSSNSNSRNNDIRTVERIYIKDNTAKTLPEIKKDKPVVPAAVKSPPESKVVKKSVLENVKVKKSVAPKPVIKKPVYKKTVSLTKKKSYSSSKSSSKRKK